MIGAPSSAFRPGRVTARRLVGPGLNRKQRRTFVALYRRKRLRLLPVSLFSAETRAFLQLIYPTHW